MKLKSILLAVIAASAQLAHAGLTTIEPDDYAAGAEITFPGVTLQALVSPGAIVDPVRSVESGAALASTGVRSFGEFNRARQFVASFVNPISYFAIDLVNNDGGGGDDSARLVAYNALGEFVGLSDVVTVPYLPWPAFATMSIAASGITRVEVVTSEVIQLDNLRFTPETNVVAEPAPWALFGLAVGLLGFSLLRRNALQPGASRV